jgi:2-oxoglutarate ferredoxin oxidoreductase subunit beta
VNEKIAADASQAPTATIPRIELLRQDRMPHIWCAGCGIGTTVNCFIRGLTQAKIDLQRTAIVSGIGCSGRVAGYMNLDTFHTTHGRAIAFATGLKLGNPELNVVVYSGDGDLFAIGGNHFIHAARRNIDMLVICVNNFNYAMTGGQVASSTPLKAVASTAPYGNLEPPFNTCHLADCCGAAYVARWTTYHVTELASTIKEALGREGFRYIEIISPCLSFYFRYNKLGTGLDAMRAFRDNSVTRHGADTRTAGLKFRGEIIVGKFIDRKVPAVVPDVVDERLPDVMGDERLADILVSRYIESE